MKISNPNKISYINRKFKRNKIMGSSSKKLEDLEVDFKNVKGKSTLLEKLHKTVIELELEINEKFELTHNGRIEKLKELIIFKEMIVIIEYLDESINVTNLNLK